MKPGHSHSVHVRSCAHLCPHITWQGELKMELAGAALWHHFVLCVPKWWHLPLTLCLSDGQVHRHFKLKTNSYKAELCLSDEHTNIQSSEYCIVSLAGFG